jgi:hypothetical protein
LPYRRGQPQGVASQVPQLLTVITKPVKWLRLAEIWGQRGQHTPNLADSRGTDAKLLRDLPIGVPSIQQRSHSPSLLDELPRGNRHLSS